MKLIIFTVLLLCSDLLFSQSNFESVDRKLVQQAISDTSAATSYSKLMQRFNDFDTSLTNNDYRLIYYGFVFQKEYNGYAGLNKKDVFAALQKKDYKQAVQICDEIL
ncbi:MAG: DUF4919 domain-containing protein, partial [Flavisolibacter sp.]